MYCILYTVWSLWQSFDIEASKIRKHINFSSNSFPLFIRFIYSQTLILLDVLPLTKGDDKSILKDLIKNIIFHLNWLRDVPDQAPDFKEPYRCDVLFERAAAAQSDEEKEKASEKEDLSPTVVLVMLIAGSLSTAVITSDEKEFSFKVEDGQSNQVSVV